MKNEKQPKKSRKATVAKTASQFITPVKAFGFMSGFALGAATMYMFDPESGEKRRDLLKQRIADLLVQGREVVESASKNVYGHVEELVTEAKSALSNVGSMPGVRTITKHFDSSTHASNHRGPASA